MKTMGENFKKEQFISSGASARTSLDIKNPKVFEEVKNKYSTLLLPGGNIGLDVSRRTLHSGSTTNVQRISALHKTASINLASPKVGMSMKDKFDKFSSTALNAMAGNAMADGSTQPPKVSREQLILGEENNLRLFYDIF
mmetsp:Transcript_12918/g.21861  ORF Transcript_12918/g.21861 Transcript_12918/m.21861 type:complete len:140 (+) Transcript_12918:335-754(+)|eukprot:CAMPEP_0168614298 /NCGR_PEP_ID=MMETSP0449_2-20121227/3901_1 /TAXON_ID=1082188 /ORGANISM="Strombidium rassoulzadegani, Strain ras09" /LENGTH=139 /DNA_ID=CAMNT_0008654971 /DNA_START=404 /DNA_END=823 /DNA_ORIENTATION=+